MKNSTTYRKGQILYNSIVPGRRVKVASFENGILFVKELKGRGNWIMCGKDHHWLTNEQFMRLKNVNHGV